MPYLSVVIPAYNEEARLDQTLSSVQRFLDSQSYDSELIVVDDGSTDRTAEIARRSRSVRLLQNGRNLGKGATVSRGMLAAEGSYVLFTDADGSTPIGEVDKLLAAHHEGYEVAIGSRATAESNITRYQPLHRVVLGKVFNLAVQLLALPGLHDTQCGFKSFARQAARDVFGRCTTDGFGFDVEVLYVARRLGYRICEVGVEWQDSPSTKVNAARDGLGMLADLLRVRYQDVRGMYE